MAGESVLTDVNGSTKVVYDKTGVRNFLPKSAIIQKKVGSGFEKGARVGDSFAISVTLQLPGGFTYAGSTGALATLKQARGQIIKQAAITPFELILRESATYVVLSRIKDAGEAAFNGYIGETMKNMKTAAANRYEMSLLHGQRGYGIVESVTDLGSNLANIVITAASWSGGLWWALIGATLDSFTSTTLNNATGPLIVKSVTASSRTVKVQYSGTIGSECAANDVLYPEGAWDGTTHAEMPSLLTQASNLTGTSLGLSATTYPNWAGNTFDVAGNLSSDIAEQMFGQLRDRGAAGTIGAYVSNKGFGVLMSELKSLRVIDSSYSPEKGKAGHKGIALYSPDYGEIEIINHPFMKDSEIFLCDVEGDVGAVGSANDDFGMAGTDAPKWEKLANVNAAELQLHNDKAAILKTPAAAMVGTGITYT